MNDLSADEKTASQEALTGDERSPAQEEKPTADEEELAEEALNNEEPFFMTGQDLQIQRKHGYEFTPTGAKTKFGNEVYMQVTSLVGNFWIKPRDYYSVYSLKGRNK